jgi:stage II sporulation protein D
MQKTMENTATPQPRKVAVGIMGAPSIAFTLNGDFTYAADKTATGKCTASLQSDGSICFCGETYGELHLVPNGANSTFTLHGVTIGKKFHWERSEDETFAGELKIAVGNGELEAINILHIEKYLQSVISSEMSCNAPLEYLKTQAVVSRSWLARILQRRAEAAHDSATQHCDTHCGIERCIKWYENDAHTLYDVCADDHCQRYEGLQRASNPAALRAVNDTCGEVIVSGGEICDARFSKCCGGATERFSSCWSDNDVPYLSPVADTGSSTALPDLTVESNAEAWIRNAPEAFCNTADEATLSQVLNGYDLETKDFFRWKEEYTNAQLSEILRRKSGIDFGSIVSLTPLQRGPSARIVQLMITGTKKRMIVGKELEIRRLLSDSHLKSSAFVVDCLDIADGIPQRIVITGAGWGHGVGLCQIGAAVMAAEGYGYRQILQHYFRNSKIENIYEQSEG